MNQNQSTLISRNCLTRIYNRKLSTPIRTALWIPKPSVGSSNLPSPTIQPFDLLELALFTSRSVRHPSQGRRNLRQICAPFLFHPKSTWCQLRSWQIKSDALSLKHQDVHLHSVEPSTGFDPPCAASLILHAFAGQSIRPRSESLHPD